MFLAKNYKIYKTAQPKSKNRVYNNSKQKLKRGSVRLMGKVGLKPKKYACFTEEEQKAYEKLNNSQRKYVDFRGKGYSKVQSYQMAGYTTKNPSQSAYMMETQNKVIPELVERLQTQRKARELTEQESALNRQIDALAKQEYAEKTLQAIDGADGETARRIQFYRDIINGKIKTVRKTIKKNALGETLETKIEEVSDIDTRIKARKELDKILNLNVLPNIDNLQIGGITVNIVDASKREELQDSRNDVCLDVDKVEVVDGEEQIVVEEKEEKAPSDHFFEEVGDE